MATRQYIAKIWLKEPMSLEAIANLFNLKDTIADYEKEELRGTVMSSKGTQGRELIIHLSWGTWQAAEKIKVYCTSEMVANEADKAEAYLEQLLNGR